MEPNYTAFWSEFKSTNAWKGLMSMTRYSPEVEIRVLRLRTEMLDAINGHANQDDIQESIWRLMELVSGISESEQVGELYALMQVHGLTQVYTLTPQG